MCMCLQSTKDLQAHSDLVLSTVTGHAVTSCFQLYVKLSATNSIIEMEKKKSIRKETLLPTATGQNMVTAAY